MKSILLAEDNLINQAVATQMLKQFGYQVTIAQNGIEAVAAFNAGKFDAIFMDCLMPQMDGFEATMKIREIEQKNNATATPIIAFTANDTDQDIADSQQAGMNEHITKPMQKHNLEQILSKLGL